MPLDRRLPPGSTWKHKYDKRPGPQYQWDGKKLWFIDENGEFRATATRLGDVRSNKDFIETQPPPITIEYWMWDGCLFKIDPTAKEIEDQVLFMADEAEWWKRNCRTAAEVRACGKLIVSVEVEDPEDEDEECQTS